MPSSMRRFVSGDVKGSPGRLGAYRSNQSTLWDSVDKMMTEMGVHSKRGAMSAIYEQRSVQHDTLKKLFAKLALNYALDALRIYR